MTKPKQLRWTQKTKEFPKDKYAFSQHLTQVGDWIQTHPMSKEDRKRINGAAKFWAWYHGVRLQVRSTEDSEGLWTVTIRLISYTRKREDQTVYDMYKILSENVE